MAFPAQASWSCTGSALPQRLSCLALLREQFIHAFCRHLREQRDNAFIASQSNGSANKVFDGGCTIGFHPSPCSVGYTRLGSCRLLGKIKSQTTGFDPLTELCHLIF